MSAWWYHIVNRASFTFASALFMRVRFSDCPNWAICHSLIVTLNGKEFRSIVIGSLYSMTWTHLECSMISLCVATIGYKKLCDIIRICEPEVVPCQDALKREDIWSHTSRRKKHWRNGAYSDICITYACILTLLVNTFLAWFSAVFTTKSQRSECSKWPTKIHIEGGVGKIFFAILLEEWNRRKFEVSWHLYCLRVRGQN